MDENQFNKRRENLETVADLDGFTLYYDEVDESLWVWDGESFAGIGVKDLYDELI